MSKPSIPKGTRDFLPIEMERRNYIFDTIKAVFRKFGFVQIETPAMENISTLMGKYGEEGDKLLFRILNSGNFFDGVSSEKNEIVDIKQLTLKIAEKGLRYDLTVPFARFVVQHRDKITFPFRRFQIQPVWRADRPQKGRYREFYQCDADIVGADSLINEVELIEMLDEVFRKFGIRVAIKLNNRKILAGIAELIDEVDRITDITVAIDKLDKIGLDNVNTELINKGIAAEKVELLQPILLLEGSNSEKLARLKDVLSDSKVGLKGIEEIEKVFAYLNDYNANAEIELDLTLARGLNYYTGAIIEVKALDTAIGSISGGGRYDNLTGIFGLEGVSGVGVSFGADRIYDVLEALNLFPDKSAATTKVLFVAFDSKGIDFALPIVRRLRQVGIACELYSEAAKIKKQMQYANDKQIPYVAIIGDEEIKSNSVMLKYMVDGSQRLVSIDEIVEKLSK